MANSSQLAIAVRDVDLCYLCQTRGHDLPGTFRDRLFDVPGEWRLRRCSRCGLIWLNPQPLPEDIPKLYASYYTHQDPGGESGSRLDLLTQKIAQAILAERFGYGEKSDWPVWLVRLLGSISLWRDEAGYQVAWQARGKKRLLDIGSGGGGFLRRMRDYGWEVVAVEPDPVAAERARKLHGLEVHATTLEQADLPPQSFDLITFYHVLEHLPDPIATLRRARELLRLGGRLVALTPNQGSLGYRRFGPAWVSLDPPRHLYGYSVGHLKQIALLAGLSCYVRSVTGRESGRHVYLASQNIRRTGHCREPLELSSRDLRLSALFWLVSASLASLGLGEELLLIARA